MLTTITTPHEEAYSDKSRNIGVLINWDENNNKIDSFIYIYRSEMYIIFNTIMEMNEYLLYGDTRINRAYVTEENFDTLFDSPIDGLFKDQLTWNK